MCHLTAPEQTTYQLLHFHLTDSSAGASSDIWYTLSIRWYPQNNPLLFIQMFRALLSSSLESVFTPVTAHDMPGLSVRCQGFSRMTHFFVYWKQFSCVTDCRSNGQKVTSACYGTPFLAVFRSLLLNISVQFLTTRIIGFFTCLYVFRTSPPGFPIKTVYYSLSLRDLFILLWMCWESYPCHRPSRPVQFPDVWAPTLQRVGLELAKSLSTLRTGRRLFTSRKILNAHFY
jgi:hypothetical protein